MQSSRSQAVPATNDPSNATGTKENPSALSTPSKPATDHSTDTAESSVDETGRGMQQQQQSSPAAAVTRSATSSGSGTTRELRRARILVTVKRTESYKRWLEENPIQRQAIIAGTATVTAEEIVGKESSLPSSK
ncbi:unnamed protein product [Pseudo-nitzschia multistriata]|uniref:Uncharacterized protein n=1 Tax=Pseudo-nitzschia multistriata TaxID=183589 RepID=A0A448ZF19_9STRA|nr:unnamed protein product [Pseudo-nitzschia multistriata]